MEIIMRTIHPRTTPLLALLIVFALLGCDNDPLDGGSDPDTPIVPAEPFAVSGSAVHYFATAIIHSQEPTETGMVQRSTDIIELTGDLKGFTLYHPTTVIDNEAGTLVNTGTQIFSGTIADSAPVILHDNAFRFEVDLATGATTGEVYLGRSSDAPSPETWFECTLDIVGTGFTPEGNGMADYSGECTPRGNAG